MLGACWHRLEMSGTFRRQRDATARTDIYGVIYRPTNFDPAKKYPVIEDIYAGPQDSFVPKAFSALHRVAGDGGIGLHRRADRWHGHELNRSKAFHDVCWKNLADAGFPDRIRGSRPRRPSIPIWICRESAFTARRPAARTRSAALLFTAISTKRPSPIAAVTTIAWTKSGGTSCGWAGPSGREYAAQSNVVNAHGLQGQAAADRRRDWITTSIPPRRCKWSTR